MRRMKYPHLHPCERLVLRAGAALTTLLAVIWAASGAPW